MTKPYYEKREITDFKDLINQSVSIYGNKNAFSVKGIMGEYTGIKYRELKKDIDAIGTEFVNMGLKHEKIAVIGENRYEWCITYLAVTCGTGTIVPLDKELPVNELRYLLEVSKVKAVVFSNKMKDKLAEAVVGLKDIKYFINMDITDDAEGCLSFAKLKKKGNDLIKIGDKKFINAKVNPDEPTILLFTSGTTGLAKGVMLSQRNICADIVATSSVVNVTEDDINLSILPLHHTYECTVSFLLMLYNGVTTSFCEGLKHMVQNLKEVRPTVMLAVPLIYESIYKKVWDTAKKNGKLNKLKTGLKISKLAGMVKVDVRKKLFKEVLEAFGGDRMRLAIAGGAASKPEVLKGLQDFGFFVIQGYGLTEASPIVFVNHVQKFKNDSIGLPLPGIEVKIVEPDSNGVGEIWIKGPIVMKGYYENKEATDKTLKDGWLNTGDLGYKDKEGYYYITGRKKNVIVTKNGKNIFPEEVEAYLSESEYIKECVVYGKEIENEVEPKVCAIIVPDYDAIRRDTEQFNMSEEELRKIIETEVKKANRKMPSYKYVKEFEIQEKEFTKTTTHKIKRC